MPNTPVDPHPGGPSPPHGTRIIALMNQKGGVGKTTTTVSLGAALAEMGKRVCLIDLDPQAHLTINYGIEPAGDHPSLYDVLVEDASLLQAIQRVDDAGKDGGSIGVVPSSIDLAAAEVKLVSALGRELILRKRLEAAIAGGADFDFVLMDCPPSLALLTINALAAAGEVLIPMQPQFLPLQGVGKLLETVQLVSRRMNPALKVSGIVLTMWDGQAKLSAEVVADLQRFIDEARGRNLPWSAARVFESRIRRNIKLAECPSFGKSILAYEPASNGASDYRGLARELLTMHESARSPASRAQVRRPQVEILPGGPVAAARGGLPTVLAPVLTSAAPATPASATPVPGAATPVGGSSAGKRPEAVKRPVEAAIRPVEAAGRAGEAAKRPTEASVRPVEATGT